MPVNPHHISATAHATRPTTGGKPPTLKPRISNLGEADQDTAHTLFRTPSRPHRLPGSAGVGSSRAHSATSNFGSRGVIRGLHGVSHRMKESGPPPSGPSGGGTSFTTSMAVSGEHNLSEMPVATHKALLHSVLKDLVSSATEDAKEFGSTALVVELAFGRLMQITSHLPVPNPLSVAGAFHLMDRLTIPLEGKSQLLEPLKREIVVGLFHGLDYTDPLGHFRRLCSGEAAPGQGLGHRPAFFELLAEQREAHSNFVAAVKAKDNTSWKQQAILQRVIARWQAMLVDRLFSAWRQYGPARDRKCDAILAVMKRKTRRLILRRFLGHWKNDTKRSLLQQLNGRVGKLVEAKENDSKTFDLEMTQSRQALEEMNIDRGRLSDEAQRLSIEIMHLKAKVVELESTLEADIAEKLRWKNLACSVVQALIPKVMADPEEVLFSSGPNNTVNTALFNSEPKTSPIVTETNSNLSSSIGGAAVGANKSSKEKLQGGFSPALLQWDLNAVKETSAAKLMLAWLNAVKQGRVIFEGGAEDESASLAGDDCSSPLAPVGRSSSPLALGVDVNFTMQENSKWHGPVTSSVEIQSDLATTLSPNNQGDLKSIDVTLPQTAMNVTFTKSVLSAFSGAAAVNKRFLITNFDDDFKSGDNMVRLLHRLKLTTINPNRTNTALSNLGMASWSAASPLQPAGASMSKSMMSGSGFLSKTQTTLMSKKQGQNSAVLEAQVIEQALSDCKAELGIDFPIGSLDVTAGNSGTAFLFFNSLLEHTHRTVLDPAIHAPMLQSSVDSFPSTDPAECRDTFISLLKQQSKWTHLINRTREHAFELLANRATVVNKDVSGQVLCEGLIHRILEEKHPQVLASIRSLRDFMDELALAAEDLLKVYKCYSTETEPALMTHSKYLKFLSDCKLLHPKHFPKKVASSFFDYLLKLPPPSDFEAKTKEEEPSQQDVEEGEKKESPSLDDEVPFGEKQDTQSFGHSSREPSPSTRESTASGPGRSFGAGAVATPPSSSLSKHPTFGRQDSMQSDITEGLLTARSAGGVGSFRELRTGTGASSTNVESGVAGYAHVRLETSTSLTAKHLVPIIMHVLLIKDEETTGSVVLSHHPSRTLGKLIQSTMDTVVPLAGASGIDDFKERVYRKDVQQVFSNYEKPLIKIFTIIGGADDDPEMSFDEFLKLVREAKLLDAHFPIEDAKKLFQFLMDGDINSGMVYREFLEAVVALCDYRIPSPWIPLSERLKTFLKTVFFPPLAAKYKGVKVAKGK